MHLRLQLSGLWLQVGPGFLPMVQTTRYHETLALKERAVVWLTLLLIAHLLPLALGLPVLQA